MLPSYLEKLTPDNLRERAELLTSKLQSCDICPNNCEVNRQDGEIGVCCSGKDVIISSYSPHFGEEPPLVGKFSSGTIFFTNCNLNCVYCQNYDISQLQCGELITIDELADIMLLLQNRGCHNINFVTPTHFVSQIVNALAIAADKGLEIPLVYNCGGFESVETLILLEDIIDIYMPDIKYSSNEIAQKFSGIKDYWNVVQKAVIEMHRQVGDLHIKSNGIASRGLLIRHLVLPDNISGSGEVIEFIADHISKDTYLNIMDQYHPAFRTGSYTPINRSITDEEFNIVIELAEKSGLYRGYK